MTSQTGALRDEAAMAQASLPCTDCPVRDIALCSYLGEEDRLCLKEFLHHIQAPARKLLDLPESERGGVLTVVKGVTMSYEKLPDGRRQVIGFGFPGDFLSLSHAEGNAPVEVEAVSSAAVCSIGRGPLQGLRRRSPALGDRLFNLADREISAARQHMVLLGRKSALERVASFFVEVVGRAGRFKDGVWEITLPMTRIIIADYLGLSFETVSRMTTQLRIAGVVALPNPNRLRVNNLDALLRLACLPATTIVNGVEPVDEVDA